jgi:hypothetical protein
MKHARLFFLFWLLPLASCGFSDQAVSEAVPLTALADLSADHPAFTRALYAVSQNEKADGRVSQDEPDNRKEQYTFSATQVKEEISSAGVTALSEPDQIYYTKTKSLETGEISYTKEETYANDSTQSSASSETEFAAALSIRDTYYQAALALYAAGKKEAASYLSGAQTSFNNGTEEITLFKKTSSGTVYYELTYKNTGYPETVHFYHFAFGTYEDSSGNSQSFLSDIFLVSTLTYGSEKTETSNLEYEFFLS